MAASSSSLGSSSKVLSVLIILTQFSVYGIIRLDATIFNDHPLTLDYYKKTCPTVLDIVRTEMESAVLSDPRNAAFILRLHFHDCFVQGCDGSILLDDTVTFKGEKTASINKNSLKFNQGFKIMDRIKNKVESECPGIVSCADILAIAARDATILVGGPYWHVPVGRLDSKSSGYHIADENIPRPNDGLLSIISKFLYQDLSVTDMVALSGAHTIGKARCESFRPRIYGDFGSTSGYNPTYEAHIKNLRSICPAVGEDDKKNNQEAPMDYYSPNIFDNSFYQILLRGEGLLNSDQQLYSSVLGIQTKKLVQKYAHDALAFFDQFSISMVKMGNITNPQTYVDGGEVRKNCRFVNT